jgi:hypothetical protein
MANPTRPVGGAPVATVWGQYMHDRALLHLGRAAVGVTVAGDAVALAPSTWAVVPHTGTDKWDPYALHPNSVSSQIALDVQGLWMITAKIYFAGVAGEHLDWAGISYGANIATQPAVRDMRSQRCVISTPNHHQFGPWFLDSTGVSINAVRLWAMSAHASGNESINSVTDYGEFSAILVQPTA